MIFLKILKVLCLVLFCVFFVMSLMLLQLNFTVRNTGFSDKYFNAVFDENIKPQVFDEIIKDLVNNIEQFVPLDEESKKSLKEGKLSPEAKKMIESYREIIRENVDVQWIKEEVPKTLKGFFAYFTGSNDGFPVLNIEPLKKSFLSLYANQIAMNSGEESEKQMKKIIQQIDKASNGFIKDGKLNEKALDNIAKIEIIKSTNLSRKTLEKIVLKIEKRKEEGTSDKELTNFFIKEMLGDKIGFSEMKSELDLNLLFKTLYGGNETPLSAARDLINGIRNKILFINIIIFLILFLLIAVFAFYPVSIFRWLGIGLILSGGVYVLPTALSGLVAKTVTLKFESMQIKDMSFELLLAEKWVLSFIGGIIRHMLVQGLIILTIGVILFVLSYFVSSYIHKKHKLNMGIRDEKILSRKRKTIVILSRVVAAILLIVVMVINIISIPKTIRSEITTFNESKVRYEEQKSKVNVNQALDKVLNSKFFKAMAESGKEDENKE